MTRIFVVPLAILLLVALIFGGCAKPAPAPTPAPAPAPAEKEWVPPVPGMKPGEEDLYFEWLFALGTPREPPPPPYSELMHVENWWGEMEKRTQGRFKVKYAWGGVTGSARELGYMTGANVVQITHTFIYADEELPYEVFTSALTGFSPTDYKKVVQLWDYKRKHPLFTEHLAAMGLVYGFSWVTGSHNVIGIRKGVKSIEKAEDFAGLQFMGREYRAIWAKELGMTPVSFPAPEMYEAFQKGMADLIHMDLEHYARPFRLNEVTDRAIDLNFGMHTCLGVVNKESWDNLPQYIKDLWWELYPEYNIDYGIKVNELLVEEALQDFKKRGIELYKLAPAEEAKVMTAAADKMLAEYAAWCEKLPNGKDVRKYCKDVIDYRNSLVPEQPWTLYP